MGNKVAYIIQLQDKFSGAAEKIKRSIGGIEEKSQQLGNQLGDLKRKIGDTGKSMVKMGVIATAAATTPIVMLGRSMVEAASDAVETASKFDQVFDDVRGKANQVAKDFSQNFGVAGSTAKNLIGDTGDLLVGFGFTGDAALALSKEVNELASDLASFQNLEGGTERASQALTKALLGETESAKSLGIVIRQNDPVFKEQIAVLMRTQNLTEMQAKAVAILGVATQQSSKAVGDVSRTWNDYANVSRRSQERTKELKESFGVLLLPVMTKVTAAVTGVIDKVNGMSPQMKQLILAVGGLVAVGGPLLILLGGIALAVGAISAPVLLVVGAISALGAALIFLRSNWDDISASISNTIDKLKSGFDTLTNKILSPLAAAQEKLSKLSGLIFGGGSTTIRTESAPVAPIRSQTDVNVNLRAPEGIIESVKSRTTGKNAGLNMGLNMVAAN